MGIIKEIPPTAGLPVYAKDLAGIFKAGSLEEDLKGYLGIDYIRITYSGTAAFYVILEAVKSLSFKKTVVIPSYICPLLPLAIQRADLRIEVCDITGDDFNFQTPELEKLCSNNRDILAIVPAHIGGLPLDLDSIRMVANKHGIYVIEDCAQALGANYKGSPVGTIGDFGFFSFCRGKGLTMYEGGALTVLRKEHASLLDAKINQLTKEDPISENLKILELLGYWAFYRPQLFWWAFKLPQLFWNLRGDRLRALSEYFTVDFPIHKVSWIRKAVVHAGFYRLEAEINKQREKAAYYLDGLKAIKGIRVVGEPADCQSNYPYLILIFDDPHKRNKAQKALDRLGLGNSRVYALAITDYDYLESILPSKICYGARYIAEREITLSTSGFLRQEDQDRTIKTLRNI